MKLFFDENMGTGVPEALRSVGVRDVDFVSNKRRIRKGTADEDWLPYVGQGRMLVISCNKAILEVEAQQALLVAESVGAVFFASGQEKQMAMLRFLLNQFEWLEFIDVNEPRPFAYIVSVSGHIRQVDLTDV